MRAAIALLLMLLPNTVTSARQPDSDELDKLYREYSAAHPMGEPCSTQTDIEEGTCNLIVKPKPLWQ